MCVPRYAQTTCIYLNIYIMHVVYTYSSIEYATQPNINNIFIKGNLDEFSILMCKQKTYTCIGIICIQITLSITYFMSRQ